MDKLGEKVLVVRHFVNSTFDQTSPKTGATTLSIMTFGIMTLSITVTQYSYTNTECNVCYSIVMLSDIMLRVIMLNVNELNVVTPSPRTLTSGLYYKHTTIVNYASSTVNKLEALFTVDLESSFTIVMCL
jgi:hypothetical protein